MAENDGIRRGDSARTGDLEANSAPDVGRRGSGVRSVDDGPAGGPTADPSAGGLGVRGEFETEVGPDDELNIVSEDDPSLGLTAHGDQEAEDWAADTGPTRTPDKG